MRSSAVLQRVMPNSLRLVKLTETVQYIIQLSVPPLTQIHVQRVFHQIHASSHMELLVEIPSHNYGMRFISGMLQRSSSE